MARCVISNVSGTIDVRGWDRNEVQVTGHLGEDVERLDVETQRRTHRHQGGAAARQLAATATPTLEMQVPTNEPRRGQRGQRRRFLARCARVRSASRR